MNRFSVSIIFCSMVFFSCGVSKKSLKNEIESLKLQNNHLDNENQQLRDKILSIESAIEEIKNESSPVVNINPTIDIEVPSSTTSQLPEEVSSVTSQLAELEKVISNDANLSSRFRSFKQGGIEKFLKVSYSDMQRVIKEAKTYKGTKHVMGGLSHSGIDCSGLLYVSFQANGITDIPRTAEEFARYGRVLININDLEAGDLVFFTNTYPTPKLVTHAGICIGNGEFIHTSSSKGVMISRINDPYYWRDKFLFGTRIIN